MSSTERDESRDRELVLKHQHSFSDSGRSSVPMWDSSDPDRAPPPLPLNPSTSSPITRPNTSANVAAAAEAFAAKARESAYTTNPMPSRSPEKSLIKGQYHKRMQTLQDSSSNVKVLSSFLDNPRSPERSPERLSRAVLDFENRSPDRSPTRSETPTPASKDTQKDLPSLRRPGPKAILGENTPQSATMLALQNTPTPKDADTSLSSITNGSSALIRTPQPQTFDAISSQILSLTSIATNLQREMAQLSRRSKDNATDLVSLKEATNARDEDIRKSLRELVTNLSSYPVIDSVPRNTSQFLRGGSLFLEEKPHVSPLSVHKNTPFQRATSPISNLTASIEREMLNSPSPYSTDGTAHIALLEKILREMGTLEGQERLLSSLAEVKEESTGADSDPTVVKKLEEILGFLKESSTNGALVVRRGIDNGVGDKPPKLELDFEAPRSLPLTRNTRDVTPYSQSSPSTRNDGRKSNLASNGTELLSEDMLKLLKRLKDSITEGGGLSAEIKALVRELRGEVLGMGREIGRKLDQVELMQKQSNEKGDAEIPRSEEISNIVQDGLAQLQEHMDRIMREHRRQSSASASSRATADTQEIYHVVKSALSEMPIQQEAAVQQPGSGIEREEILEAVREAWETYKPEIELQNFGLERDEILQCLKEGLHDYQPKDQSEEIGGISYEEVLDAVKEGLKDFTPPAPAETEAAVTREEMLTIFRECLESFDFPTSREVRDIQPEITREDVLEAVREGLSINPPISREMEFNRDDLFDAVKAGLEGVPTPMVGVGEQVLEKMQDLIDGMRGEFQQYSAANGRDTEQVLDAMKDGLEALRTGIETYVDRAADVTGKDEIIETIRDGLEHLRIDLEGTIASEPRDSEQTNSGELLDAMEKEFEHLRQTIATSMLRNGNSSIDKDEILDAIKEGMEDMKGTVSRSGASGAESDTFAVVREEFEYLRATMTTLLTRTGSAADKEEIIETIREGLAGLRTDVERGTGRPESILSNTSELLDAFNDGVDSLKADIQKVVNKPLDMTVNYEILDTLKEGLVSVRADIDRLHNVQVDQESLSGRRGGGEVVIADPEISAKGLHRTDIENLEVMITQLRMKVESFDGMPPPAPEASESSDRGLVKEDFERLESMIRDTQTLIASLAQHERSLDENIVTKEDTDAIETLLRNTKAQIDEMVFPEPEGMARTEHLDSVEGTVKSVRDLVEDLATRFEAEGASKMDVGVLEILLKEVQSGLQEIREKITLDEAGQQINKRDIETLESLCIETKSQIEALVLPDVESLPTKVAVEGLGDLIKEFHEKAEIEANLTAQAFEARKIEHGGIADKIEDVKGFMDDVRHELKSKIVGNAESIESIAATLRTIDETLIATDATPSVKELLDTIRLEFDRTHGNHEATKLEMEQNRDLLVNKHDEHKATIVGDINAVIDSRFNELMTKYDDAQLAAESKDTQHSEAVDKTQIIAEDLKLLVDTLGATVTDLCQRTSDDSKTVFTRVEDVIKQLDDSTGFVMTEAKAEHQLTRAELSKTLVAVESVQANTKEYHPKILSAIGDILSIVGQHYEQAQRSTEEIKTSVNAIPAAIPLPAITGPLPSPIYERDIFPTEKYDDSEVHAKLDKLVEHVSDAGKSTVQLEMLEQIRKEISTTAADFNAFVASQQVLITNSREAQARETEEILTALQKRTAQKEMVEADVVRISSEKADLATSVAILHAEEKDLISQKARLQADLSSLETALQIRREEMELMEARAEGLERRILEGVLDHSRSLLITSKPPSDLKAMNLKRVPSTASTTTVKTRNFSTSTALPSVTSSAVSSGIGMALKRRQPTRSNTPGALNSPKGERRILSLSTIGGNQSQLSERSLVLANPSTSMSKGTAAFGSGGLKRSHSVKSNFPTRKTSWGGTRRGGMYADEVGEGDKENSILDEEDEEEESERETERRTSYGADTERRTSYSETCTGTGSYGTGSVVDDYERGTSYSESVAGNIGHKDRGIDDDEIDLESERGSLREGEELQAGDRDIVLHSGEAFSPKATDPGYIQDMIVYGLPSDSGIGTDIPTAALDGGSEYFRKA